MVKIFLTCMGWMWAIFFPIGIACVLLVSGPRVWYRQFAGWIALSIGISLAFTCLFHYMP